MATLNKRNFLVRCVRVFSVITILIPLILALVKDVFEVMLR